MDIEDSWAPQPGPRAAFVKSQIFEVVYGGARGDGGEGAPMLYVFDTCRDFIRTAPVLQHDPARLEDLDTEAEDHIADNVRFPCRTDHRRRARVWPG